MMNFSDRHDAFLAFLAVLLSLVLLLRQQGVPLPAALGNFLLFPVWEIEQVLEVVVGAGDPASAESAALMVLVYESMSNRSGSLPFSSAFHVAGDVARAYAALLQTGRMTAHTCWCAHRYARLLERSFGDPASWGRPPNAEQWNAWFFGLVSAAGHSGSWQQAGLVI